MKEALEILEALLKLGGNMIWLDENGNGIPMQKVIDAIAEIKLEQLKSKQMSDDLIKCYLKMKPNVITISEPRSNQ